MLMTRCFVMTKCLAVLTWPSSKIHFFNVDRLDILLRKQNLFPSQGLIACLPLVPLSWCNCNIIAFLLCYLNSHILVPGKINWEDHVRKNSVDWDWQMAVCKLFEERPVWPRQSLYERLQDDGVHVSQNQFKRFHCSSTLVELPHHLVLFVMSFNYYFLYSFCILLVWMPFLFAQASV